MKRPLQIRVQHRVPLFRTGLLDRPLLGRRLLQVNENWHSNGFVLSDQILNITTFQRTFPGIPDEGPALKLTSKGIRIAGWKISEAHVGFTAELADVEVDLELKPSAGNKPDIEGKITALVANFGEKVRGTAAMG